MLNQLKKISYIEGLGTLYDKSIRIQKIVDFISIQLKALQNNNIPYNNAGIEQTWEFAHPTNKEFTGPLSKFTFMMYSPSYEVLLNHYKHNIILIKKNEFQSFFFIEIIDKTGIKFGFQWIVEKVSEKGIFLDCWMTKSVSQPIRLSESI